MPGTPGRSGSGSLSLASTVPHGRLSPRSSQVQEPAEPLVRPNSPDAPRPVRQHSHGAVQAEVRLTSPDAPRPARQHSHGVPLAEAVAIVRRQSLRPTTTATAPTAATSTGSSTVALVNKASLLAGSSLAQLMAKVAAANAERELALQQELKRAQAERCEMEELLGRSGEELSQLVAVVSHLHDLQRSGADPLPDALQLGPERPRPQAKPPFFWQPSNEYAGEFEVSGEYGEVVTKLGDFEDQGWVIPVGGAWRLMRGGVYRWTLRVERKCPTRPQLQLGIHGVNHSQPWRLVTTSRCSWSRDDEPWQDRPGGDRLIDEGSWVHLEVDLTGQHSRFGTLALAINDEPYECYFEDIPLGSPYPLIPVVSMGGDQSRVRLCPSY